MSVGPFEHHDAKPTVLETEAATMVRTSGELQSLSGDLTTLQRRAAQQVEGMLLPLLQPPPRVALQATDLQRASVLSGGVLRLFASSVTRYNTAVDDLNRRYQEARAQHFGVDTTAGGARDDEDVDTARADLMGQLSREERTLSQTLEGEGDDQATMLDRGPTESNLTRLVEAGALMLPELGLAGVDPGDVDVAAMIRNLQRNGVLPDDVDPEAVEEATEALRRLLDEDDYGVNGNREDLERVLEAMQGLGGSQGITFVLSQFTDDELRRWNEMNQAEGGFLWHQDGLEHWDQIDLNTAVLTGADQAALDRLSRLWPEINPDVSGVDGDQASDDNPNPTPPEWGVPPEDRELFEGPDGEDRSGVNGVDQGGVGDCWMMAKLGALTEGDGGWAQEHVSQNENGTIAVTMYDEDGNPHQVTVTRDLPLNEDGSPRYAAQDGDNGLWSGYYEKAFALASQHGSDGEDGYGGIEGGWSEDDAELMTGQEADEIGADASDVQEAHENGQPVVVTTKGDEWDHEGFHGNHAYHLRGYDSDGNLVLVNPWSDDEPELVVSPEEFEEHFSGAAALNP